MRTAVINVVGLTPDLIGGHTPNLKSFAERNGVSSIGQILPSVTCSVQSTYLTGKMPSEHGIVGNGWYFRDECEVKFWRQSNKLVQSPKIWDIAKDLDPSFVCANMFWWYNMYSTVDLSVTPRPMYPADGRKLPDVYSQPPELRDNLQTQLGQFPLFEFWGPRTTINSSAWIAKSSMEVEKKYSPSMSLVYLPHLDYILQQEGPDSINLATHLAEIDQVCGELIDFYKKRGVLVTILSEYGIVNVDNPIHLNRVFREKGWIGIREELGRELLDPGASKAFAVADHQLAHVYVEDASILEEVKNELERVDGIAQILHGESKVQAGLDHERSGELVAVAMENSWFSYYYWMDDDKAPDFARCVDIHRKPGYDPVELFVDPQLKSPMLKAGFRLAQKKLGFRYLMDLIPLDASLVKGSHGSITSLKENGPVFISECYDGIDEISPTAVMDILLSPFDL